MSEVISANYNILCVDDNENNLFTLSALLKTVKNIYSIDALDAKAALDILIKRRIDLILLDVQMPDINGFELAKMIKSNKKTKDIPILFVTAVFKSEEFIKEGFDIGAVDYITKPIDDNQLLNKIILYLKIFDQKNRLVQSEKKFYDIAQSITDGIYTLDTNNKTTFINKTALEVLGYDKHALIGEDIYKYIHYKDVNNKPIEPHNCKMHQVVNSEINYVDRDAYLIKQDGSFLPVSLNVRPLYNDNKTVGSVTIFQDKSEQLKIIALEEEKIQNHEQIIHSMVDMIESRDSYTAGHTKRVAHYCELIAIEMGYGEEEIELLKKAAWLHDIGKISTPDSVLLKPSKLNTIEYKLIQEHLSSGYEMLNKVDQYKVIANIMREHHEKYDGSGYPRGLRTNEIIPLSRIMIVADAFDAMTTNRVYKPRKSLEVALKELQDLSSKHFHPEVVEASLVALAKIDVDIETSQLPQSYMEEQRFAYFYKDRLTNLFIIDYLSLILRYYIHSDSIYLYSVKLQNFTKYNREFSWSKGDEFLVEFARYINDLYDDVVVFRVEGDDFLILSEAEIETIDDDIGKFTLFKNSLVNFNISMSYIEDIKEKKFKILDIINK